jgi:hypothetical protein
MRHTKCCNNCEHGLPLHLTKDILCKYRGVVTIDYVCFKYKAFSDLSSNEQNNHKCIHCENFLVELDSQDQHVGKCKLFSAREFDGTARNVCSKFSKKLLIEVS